MGVGPLLRTLPGGLPEASLEADALAGAAHVEMFPAFALPQSVFRGEFAGRPMAVNDHLDLRSGVERNLHWKGSPGAVSRARRRENSTRSVCVLCAVFWELAVYC